MTKIKLFLASAGIAMAGVLSAGTASAAVASCDTLGPNLSYYDFDSCVRMGNPSDDAKFDTLSSTVSAVFGPLVVLNKGDSFTQGPGTGEPLGGNITELTITQQMLDDFIFIHFKKGDDFQLFGLAGLSVGDTLASGIGSNISHWGALAGTVPPFIKDSPKVPLPASGFLLIAALGGAGYGLRRRKA